MKRFAKTLFSQQTRQDCRERCTFISRSITSMNMGDRTKKKKEKITKFEEST